MVKLTEDMVIARAKTSDLESITKLNFWGSDLTDTTIVRRFKRAVVMSFSLNMITTLADFQYCVCLCELYIRRNNIQSLREICYLQELPKLKHLLMSENPCCETAGDLYRPTVLRALPNLEVLDNQQVTALELEYALQLGLILEHPGKDKEKTIVPGTKFYEEPVEDKIVGGHSTRIYDEMVRQRNMSRKNNSSLRLFSNPNQDEAYKSVNPTSKTGFRPVTATPLVTLETHQNNNFSYQQMTTGNSMSDYRSLINQQRLNTTNNNNSTSPILEFYRNDFSRQQMSQPQTLRRRSNVAQNFQCNNNDCEYRQSTNASNVQKTNLVTAALLLFADMSLDDLYRVDEAIRTRINDYNRDPSLGLNS